MYLITSHTGHIDIVGEKLIEDNVLRLFSIAILAVGIYAYARSSSVAERLRDFYSQYPTAVPVNLE